MKAKIRKTGEIVDIICYGGSPNRRSDVIDYVNYIDSQDVEHIKDNHLNIYWDFEFIEIDTDKHWQDVRERAAIAAMQGTIAMLNNSDGYAFREVVVEGYKGEEKTYPKEIAQFAVACADAIVERLKEK